MRGSRRLLPTVLVVVAVGGAAMVLAPVAGAKAKTPDPCSLITDDTLSQISGGWAVEKTDALTPGKNCLVYLQSDGDSSTVNVFVDAASGYSSRKAGVKQVKSVPSIGSGGYSGDAFGDAQVGFKTKTAAVALVSTDLEAADLVILAKAANKLAK
ncbi:MAG: hypothetical protein U0W40_14410 [Acidimicrobiia bacterium]